ncbi:hypothetical protein QX776_02355 [Alteromonadaceae bacterium BrNp21-10]|nr:hypothetical protein [Alteromonadaceae bacterium BrNp21-10]
MLFFIKKMRWLILLCWLPLFTAVAADDVSVKAQRAAIDSMSEKVLAELYTAKSSVKGLMKNAHGYAVFNNDAINLILATSEGYGVVKNVRSGDTTYMLIEDTEGKFGDQDKTFKLIFIFNTSDSYERFATQDWSNVQAAPFGKWFASLPANEAKSVLIYQFIDDVLVPSPAINHMKFWIDEKLN